MQESRTPDFQAVRLGLKLGAAHLLETIPNFEYKVGLQISGTPNHCVEICEGCLFEVVATESCVGLVLSET
jgi:hypothetical protein